MEMFKMTLGHVSQLKQGTNGQTDKGRVRGGQIYGQVG